MSKPMFGLKNGPSYHFLIVNRDNKINFLSFSFQKVKKKNERKKKKEDASIFY